MKSSALRRALHSVSLLTLFATLPARAADLAYAGRLVDAAGAPLAGPVEVTLRFYGSAAGSDQLGSTKTFADVPLADGVFQLTVSLDAAEEAAVFQDGTALVFVEIEAGGKLYPRQRFTPVPLALRIPVDNDSLVYGPDARLAVGEIAMGQVQGLSTALAQKLDSTPASGSTSGYLSSADWTKFDAKQDAISASSSLTTGSIATAEQDAVVIKPYGSQAGETGELRFEERDGGNYVAFKAPDTLTADEVWTLPAADGAAGEVLATDGSGRLSWMALSGVNLLDASIGDAKLLGITTPGKVSGAAMTSGTIGGTVAFAGSGGVSTSGNITVSSTGSAATELRFQDDDASNYVAFRAPSSIAANKVFTLPAADGAAGQFLATDGTGALTWDSPAGAGDMLKSANLSDVASVSTARANLGLGALATLSSVASSEIVDGSLVDADIAGTAAITTSKLSGALTAVSGHGLGSLATLSSVGSGDITDGAVVDADISAAAAIATSKLSGAVTSISGHGLGALATASAVGSSEITDGSVASVDISDGTITDADVSGAAAIATSKLSGSVTSIAGHGLGSLATMSSVSSTEIVDGEIIDADISVSAAIATSKLSGAVTSIAGHGLGSLASLSSISSAEIGDSTIVDADISTSAAIATSKLSGALTAVSGHGLGALATLSTVSATEITDGTIANADISATAAIDASKIASGTVSSTEFQYLDGLTGGVQAQLDAKASAASPTFTGVISAASGSAAAPSYSFTGDSDTGIWSSGADAVNVSTGGSERLRVTSTGNVGIGTTNPIAPLHVGGTTGWPVTVEASYSSTLISSMAGPILVNTDQTANNWVGIHFKDTASGPGSGAIGLQITDHANDYGDVAVATRSASGFSEKFRVTSAGNVGIGTTTPGGRLDVGSASQFRVSSTGDLTKINNVAYSWPSAQGATATTLTNDGSGNLTWSSSGSSQWTTSASNIYFNTGNAGIGTTSPSVLLHVEGGSTQATDVRLKNTSTNGRSWTVSSLGQSHSYGAGKFNIQDETASASRLTIDTSGNVGIGTTNPSSKLQVNGTISATGYQNDNAYYIFIGGGTIGSYNWGSGYYTPLWSFTNITANNLSSSNFSATTGEFIAPVKGLWLIKCALYPASGSQFEFFLAKNATWSPLNVGNQDLLAFLNNITEGVLTSPVMLNVNDKVGCGSYANSGSITSWNGRSSFNAVLLQQLP